MEEKRRFRRIIINVEVLCRPEGMPPHSALAKDIGLGGMFVRSEHRPAFGASIVVEVKLPRQREAFQLPGVVRWQNGEGYGIQFGLLGARETHAITRLFQ